ncbi:MAG TPA: hypothetical protein VGB78_03445 [Thermoplasmata archaeon]
MSADWLPAVVLLGTIVSITAVLTFMMRGKIHGSRRMLIVLALGLFAGIGGASHGPGEMLQGSTAPTGLMIEAWPGLTALNGEPAMTLIPNYLVTGVLATVMGLAVGTWTATSVGKRNGGLILILLSVLMLLVGGGLMPLIPGVAAGGLWYLNGHPKSADSRLSSRCAEHRICAEESG